MKHKKEEEGKKKAKVAVKERVSFAAPLMKEAPVVAGQSLVRVDGREKVTGKLLFGADIEVPNVLHGKVLRSPYPHANILKIDTSKARAVPGVAAVLTARDVPGRNGFGAIIPDQPVICGDKVRYVGDAVALVAAETEELAIEAVKAIEVQYEPIPAVFDPIEALKPDAPQVHEKGNLLLTSKVRKGDIEQGFREADVVVEGTFRVPFLEHAYLEPDVILAIPADDGSMTVKGPMQAPFTVRRNVAPVLDLPISHVRAVQTPLGGGFGGKEDSPIDTSCRAAVLAYKTGRPVRMEYDREEITLSTAKRHPMIIHCKLGATKEGDLTALEGTIYNEQGAYASLGPVLPPAGGTHVHAVVMLPGPYVIPHVKVDGHLVFTNHPYGGAMRGFGAPQVNFVHESLMEDLATALGMNPYDLRMKNCFELGSETATGQILDQSVGMKDTLKQAASSFKWHENWKPLPTAQEVEKAEKLKGYGMALGWYRTSIGIFADGCGANLHVQEDGSVLLYTGITEMGQGSYTVLSQIAAEQLGVRMEDIRIVPPDTDYVPESGPTVGSRSTTLMGNAIILAANQIRESLFDAAEEMLLVSKDDLAAKDRLIYSKKDPKQCIEFKEVAKRCMGTGRRLMGQGWWTPPKPSLDLETGQGSPYFVYSYSTQMAEVEVDVQTGEVEVKRLTAAFDIGKAINPVAVEGQIEGGVTMGLGYALMEEVLLDFGNIQNLSLQEYIIPTSLDVPEIQPILVETTNVHGPFGAKGVGEMPNIPTAPAIINAIYNAVGVRIREIPASPERVFMAVRKRVLGDLKH